MTIMMGTMAIMGAVQKAKADKDAAEYNDEVAKTNQGIANNAARDAQAMGELEALSVHARTRASIGRQKAQMAANGGVIGVGSNATIIRDTEQAGEEDAFTARLNARNRAYGHQVNSMNIGAQNKLAQAESKSSQTQSLLSGVRQAGGVYADYKAANS
jgi:hypothetical protein